jgi:hypothetical protein
MQLDKLREVYKELEKKKNYKKNLIKIKKS